MIYYDIHRHTVTNQYQRDSSGNPIISIWNCNIVEPTVVLSAIDFHNSYSSLGIHPSTIHRDQIEANIALLEKYALYSGVKAIGECGLDKCCPTPWDLQQQTFVSQIQISEQVKKPLIIHCVKAFDELISLKKVYQPTQTWIIHGFRGKPEQAKQLERQDFYFSFGFQFNEETLKTISPEKIFFETDDTDCSIQSVYEKAERVLGWERNKLIEQIGKNVRFFNFFVCL